MFNDTDPLTETNQILHHILHKLNDYVSPTEGESVTVQEYQCKSKGGQEGSDCFLVRRCSKRRNSIFTHRLTLSMTSHSNWAADFSSIMEEGLDRNKDDLNKWKENLGMD